MLDAGALKQLREIFLVAFPLEEFDLLMDDIGKRRDQFGLGSNYRIILNKVLDYANRYGWLNQIVEEALRVNPSLGDLYGFAQSYFAIGVSGTTADRLERLIQDSNAEIDILVALSRIAEMYRRTCQILIDDGLTPIGTGFLIGPSAVITNHHVMAPVISGIIPANRVRVKFDYAKRPDGTTEDGTQVGLAAANQWKIDDSAVTEWDRLGTGNEPSPDQLDYTVIRLARAIGNDPVAADSTNPNAKARGWVDLTKHAAVPPQDSAIYIVQHPKGDPMKLAQNTKSTIGLITAQTRLKHRTTTEKGSSGSPTLNAKFELVALHNSGDPDFSQPAAFNSGIPIRLILDRLGPAKLADIAS